VTGPVRIALVGAGAFGTKHLDALSAIGDAAVVAVADESMEKAEGAAAAYGVTLAAADLGAVLTRDDVDAVILATPTPRRAEQAVAVLRAGKHVEVEIPLADNWAGAQNVARAAAGTGLWPWSATPVSGSIGSVSSSVTVQSNNALCRSRSASRTLLRFLLHLDSEMTGLITGNGRHRLKLSSLNLRLPCVY
jgi:Oxidoreductase family, NAD-binding Rossmann fold